MQILHLLHFDARLGVLGSSFVRSTASRFRGVLPHAGGEVNGLLKFELELDEPLPTGQMDGERLKLRRTINEMTSSPEGNTGWFEDEMLNLQGRLRSACF